MSNLERRRRDRFWGELLAGALLVVGGFLLGVLAYSRHIEPAPSGEFRAAQGHRELFYMSTDGELIVGGDVTARDVACAWAKDRGRAPKDCP